MIQQDSITVKSNADNETSAMSSHINQKIKEPIAETEITSVQTSESVHQDTALKVQENVRQTDWSHRYNPMQTPLSHAEAVSLPNLNEPLYHSHSFVQPDSVYRPEYAISTQGVAGDPVPYSISNDNFITSILLGCFILTAISLAKSGNFIQRQVKSFFHAQREGTTVITETSSELRFQFFLLLQTSLLLALIFLFYTKAFVADAFSIPQYHVIGIYTGIFTIYFLAKFLLYALTNWIFFDRKKNEHWMKSELFLISTEGLALFPVSMLMSYFNFSIESTVIYTASIIIMAKILSFYKTYLIFFRKNIAILQSFLYFCALEIMPLITLWGLLMFTDNYLKVIF